MTFISRWHLESLAKVAETKFRPIVPDWNSERLNQFYCISLLLCQLCHRGVQGSDTNLAYQSWIRLMQSGVNTTVLDSRERKLSRKVSKIWFVFPPTQVEIDFQDSRCSFFSQLQRNKGTLVYCTDTLNLCTKDDAKLPKGGLLNDKITSSLLVLRSVYLWTKTRTPETRFDWVESILNELFDR